MAAATQILKLVNIELLVTAGHSFDNFYSLDIFSIVIKYARLLMRQNNCIDHQGSLFKGLEMKHAVY